MMPISSIEKTKACQSVLTGVKPSRRTVHGVLLLDKPVGMTSNQALQTAKRLFNARKAGHTGSLDPLASGMLPLCFGEATKISAYLLDADKEYEVVCQLGIRTVTGDAEGTTLETRAVPALTRIRVEKILAGFCGELAQIPPMYSALKYRGQRLYDLARRGIEVQREPRTVTIHELKLVSYSQEILEFSVRCSKGTYIRTLVEDLANALGTCGHVSRLRRVLVGPYERMHGLEEIKQRLTAGYAELDSLLLPVDSAVNDWPRVSLSGDAAWYFQRGQAVVAPGAPVTGWLRVYSEGYFLGLGEVLQDGRVTPRRLMNFN